VGDIIKLHLQLNPRGMSIRAVLIVSFHRMFITQMDKAYSVECFYMEAERVGAG
jgi:hypothetical protein